MSEKFLPFRMTTTLTFHHCENKKALISPPYDVGMKEIVRVFPRLLVTGGFDVMRHPSGEYKVSFHRFWEVGKEWGYTMGAVLAASDASVHTYPESEYGSCYELELNLCYLTEDVVAKHGQSITETNDLFYDWLDPDCSECIDSQKRYFRANREAAL